MSGTVGIIGGGWYGCHIASSLKAAGFEVALFEQHDVLLNEASGNNQFRLHLGFHYPRHAGTRIQSRDGYSRFLEQYGALSRPVEDNVYAVPLRKSLVDFETYQLVMSGTGLQFRVTDHCSIPLKNTEGLLLTKERVLLIDKARTYFTTHLNGSLHLGTAVTELRTALDGGFINDRRFDYVVDATWGHLTGAAVSSYYEPTLLLYFEGRPGLPAITFVDGPLYSLYPTEDETIYTLSSVPLTPLGNFQHPGEARRVKDSVNSALVQAKLEAMVAQAQEGIPTLLDHFRFMGPQLSIKTKPFGESADRSCQVEKQGRLFRVMSGKIDTVFFAADRILSLIQDDREAPSKARRRTLKTDRLELPNQVGI